MASAVPEPSPVVNESANLQNRYQHIQSMVVDYAIGLAILGLFPRFLTPVLTISFALLLKMLWDIAKRWQFAVVYNPIAIAGGLLNGLGSLAIALLAWLTFVFLGTFIPLIDHFGLSAAFMSGTWTLGAAANQFFFNGYLKRLAR
jgi:hypothetical protein